MIRGSGRWVGPVTREVGNEMFISRPATPKEIATNIT